MLLLETPALDSQPDPFKSGNPAGQSQHQGLSNKLEGKTVPVDGCSKPLPKLGRMTMLRDDLKCLLCYKLSSSYA
eukprot:jgi/Botrbrau1/7890/Bobra.9_2s0063.1